MQILVDLDLIFFDIYCFTFVVICSDVLPITRHADFKLFACMNPATDVGKKDLPLGIRNRYWSPLLYLFCIKVIIIFY